MFHMMNEARVGVGAGAAALGMTSHLHAVAYARERTQGRLAGQDPASAMVPLIRHADVRRMLLASKAYAEGAVALVMYGARLLDDELTAETSEERAAAALLLDALTPIIKSWPSQWCLVANDLAIQVHGGYGYTREFPVEQFYRDNRLNPIHEGTFGIQARDLLGRKVAQGGGAGLRAITSAIRATLSRAAREHAADAARLEELVARAEVVTAEVLAVDDPEARLADSAAYLEAMGHLVVAWLWLDLITTLDGREDAFAEGKRAACSYFFAYEVPKIAPLFDVVAARSRLLVDLDDSVL